MMSDVIIRLEDIQKNYGETGVVNDLNLEVREGEFFSVLGPSGCGKTTTLRIIAGLLAPDEGDVYLAGKKATDTPPYQRNLGMVFQNYALFPHMTVEANVAYGLKAHGYRAKAARERVDHYLNLVGLTAMAKRKPKELSGGQQQRVALARALAIEPVVLLLDEPLSNLDAKMREEMQMELKTLHQRLKFTAFYVTHDQDEALSMSDRLAILKDGRLEQIGSPAAVYNEPNSPFVADFIGGTNLIPGTLTDGHFTSRCGDAWAIDRVVGTPAANGAVHLAIRPQALFLCPIAEGVFEAAIAQVRYMGDRSVFQVKLDSGQVLEVSCPNQNGYHFTVGQRVGVRVMPDSASVFC